MINLFLYLSFIIFHSIICESIKNTMLIKQYSELGFNSTPVIMILDSKDSDSYLFSDSKYLENIIQNEKEYNEKLNYRGIITESFKFKLKKDSYLTSKKYTGIYGLGISETNKNTLFDTLKENNLINSKYITICMSPKETKSYFKNEYILDENKKYSCKLTNRNDLDEEYKESWICDYSHMFISKTGNIDRIKFEDVDAINGRVLFDLRSKYIIIPIEWGEYIIKKLDIGEYAKINFNEKEGDGYINFTQKIDNDTINDLPNLFFIIEGYSYEIKTNSLFEIVNNDIISYIRFSKENNNIWTLGYPFFINYNISFNYDDASVEIYGNNVINFKNEYEQWKIDNIKFLKYDYSEKNLIIIGFVVGILIIGFTLFFICRSYWCNTKKIHSKLIEENLGNY